MHVSRRIAPVAALSAVAFVLAGCSSPATLAAKADTPKVVSGAARLDAATDSAVLPLDKYSAPQTALVGYARNLVEQKCMESQGLTYQVYKFEGVDDPVGWRLFGLWDMKFAEQYGYGLAPDPVAAAEQSLNSNMSPAAKTADKACNLKAQKTFVQPDPNARLSAESLEYQAFMETNSNPVTKQLTSKWQACMIKQGVKVNAGGSGPLAPDVNTDTTPLEQQLKIAVQDVNCKTTYNIAQRLGDIDASYQQELITEYQSLLNAQLKKINSAQASAQQYVNANG